MLIAIINDTHAGIRNSSEIFLDNSEEFYSKVFFPVCEEKNIKQILHLGDYYDNRKAINVKTINHNRKSFLNKIRENRMTMDIIPGNHDAFFKNTNDVNSLKELLGYFVHEINIIMEPTVVKYDSLDIGMVPWITEDNSQKCLNFIANCKTEWLAGHFEINGFEMMRGIKNTHGISSDLFKRFELVLSGHFHTSSRQDNIWYLGSQMEFSFADAHDPKYFHILDTETRKIEKVLNPYTLFEKITYNDKENNYKEYDVSKLENKFVRIIVVERENNDMFDNFIERIQKIDTHDLKIIENFEEFSGDKVGNVDLQLDDTVKLINDYIDNVDTKLDKSRVKTMMKRIND